MIDQKKIQELTKQFLLAIGEDPSREGLVDTPRRVAEMCNEIFNPKSANLKRTCFSQKFSGMVLVKNIEFSSMCEHHLLPFFGVAHIAYIPNKKVLGLSKVARIVDFHSKSPQLQERLTQEILDDIQKTVSPKGVAVWMEATHTCMTARGVKKEQATTVTSLFDGEFNLPENKMLFLTAIKEG